MHRDVKIKQQAGNALMEFALVLPIMILIIVGIIDFSLLFYDKAVITNASREGARYGIVFRSPAYATVTDVTTYTKTYCTNRLVSFASPKPVASVTVTPSSAAPKAGDTLTVTVSYTYTDLLLHHFIGHSALYNVSATTVMEYE